MKTALVTGASGGIGLSVTKTLLEEGYFVFAQYNNNRESLEKLKESLSDEVAQNLFCYQADFSVSVQAVLATKNALRGFNHLDVVVNNAGVGLYKLITDTTEEEWDRVFTINLKTAYLITNLALEKMISNKSGKIINVSSMWGKVGASMEVCYSASKSALIGYTKALAKEVALSGITVNCICPGVIDTQMNKRFSKEDMLELKEQTPLGRLGEPQYVSKVVKFLISDVADFITGQIISCDGGFTL